jgi:hypothetical protein
VFIHNSVFKGCITQFPSLIKESKISENGSNALARSFTKMGAKLPLSHPKKIGSETPLKLPFWERRSQSALFANTGTMCSIFLFLLFV